MMQNASITAFTILELLRENQQCKRSSNVWKEGLFSVLGMKSIENVSFAWVIDESK